MSRRSRSNAGAHEAAAVEDDPDGLAALGLVLAGDEAAAAGGGRPADVAQVVAFAVVAQAFKVAAETAQARLAELQINLAAAGKEYLLLLAGAQSGIDADRWVSGARAQRSASPRPER